MKTNNKILSITIPSYNVEKYLPEIIPYYLDERVIDDIEILIINDGSKDQTAEIGKQFQSDYPNSVRLINKQNGGHGSTINRGIEEASGKYFKVIDGDDWVDTEGLVLLVQKLKNIDVDLVMNPFVKVNIDDGSKKTIAINSITPGEVLAFDEVLPSLIDCYQLHSNTYRTDVLRGMHKIDENCFYVDQEYIIYPIDRIKSMMYLGFPVYQYRVGNIDQSMSLKNMQKNRKMHERVIFSLIDVLKNNSHSDNICVLLKEKIGKMCQLQIDTYISMDKDSDIKNELHCFIEQVKNSNNEIYTSIPGKKATCLRLFGKNGYDIIKAIKRLGG